MGIKQRDRRSPWTQTKNVSRLKKEINQIVKVRI